MPSTLPLLKSTLSRPLVRGARQAPAADPGRIAKLVTDAPVEPKADPLAVVKAALSRPQAFGRRPLSA